MKTLARLGVVILMLCISLPAMAISLEEAKNRLDEVKSQGLVGEKPTGYLGVVRNESQATEIVRVINQARREEYARIAHKHDIAVTKVESVAGQKAIEKTPAGQYIMKDDEWVTK